MHSLVVQALAMRQLGRLNPRHLLAAGYGLRQAEWCPRTIHTRQLWGCSAFPALGRHSRPALCGRDTVRGWSVHPLRFGSNKKKSAARSVKEDEQEDEEEDQDKKDQEDSDYEDEVDEKIPEGYDEVKKYLPNFSFEAVMRHGMGISRQKIVNSVGNNLRLNGKQAMKKSSVILGDTLDLVVSENTISNTVTLIRIVIVGIMGDSIIQQKYNVTLRRWKCLELPKDEVFKQYKLR
ncbi:LOW QUALITY PROTEIN: uncharacterized protein C6orf203-like [Cottoperca gobio]|uniref:LOW QUALITY PROTEIN: uncharacterized protein C6orf203-like n=1 Tax=Cottoperca gobio TaxID=56716 RepID=A0A6J2S503_COTGO|nr:LOW QUALITY PROTEIN: uncharacterized protein C6orf203-like [Cottoperca gobio]